MSSTSELPLETTHEVRDACLCLHLRRAARAVARRFDAAFRPLGLTNGQFSLMMSLNRPQPPSIGQLSERLAMDRTTLTANLKPLERRGLVRVSVDDADKRGRRLTLTPAGRALLAAAVPIWRETHAEPRAPRPLPPRRSARRSARALLTKRAARPSARDLAHRSGGRLERRRDDVLDPLGPDESAALLRAASGISS